MKALNIIKIKFLWSWLLLPALVVIPLSSSAQWNSQARVRRGYYWI
jgi:hypothetical protein